MNKAVGWRFILNVILKDHCTGPETKLEERFDCYQLLRMMSIINQCHVWEASRNTGSTFVLGHSINILQAALL